MLKYCEIMYKVNIETVYYNLTAYIWHDMLYIITVKVERLPKKNVFSEHGYFSFCLF